MPESKTIVFGNDSNNGMLGLLAPLLRQQGIDPNLAMSMMNNRNNGFGEGGWFIWVIFLFFLMGWGRNGWGGNNGGNCGDGAGLANLINNDNGRDLLMSAIQGNANAISQLSATLNCSVGQIQQAINAVMSNVQQVANSVGQSSLQVINALQQGNMQIAQQISNCCCENRLAICNQTNALQQSINSVATGQERGFSSVAYETQKQTCDLQNSIKDATSQIIAGQKAAEMRELQREIAERDRKIAEQGVVINNGQQTAIFGQMISQATTPIVNAVGGLQKDVDSIKCKLPETATIAYSPVVGVPTCLAAQYGLGYGFGFNGYNVWG